MKTKTMKKALSLFLAVLMIALAIPFTLLTVAAEEATEVKIVDFTAFGKHVKTDGKMHDVGFYGSMPAAYAMDGFVGKRSDNAYKMYGFEYEFALKNWFFYNLEKGNYTPVEYFSPYCKDGSLLQAWSSVAAFVYNDMDMSFFKDKLAI